MFKYEFKSRTAERPYLRTTIAKRRKIVEFSEEQTIYNPNVFTWAVLKACKSNTLKNLSNLQKGFRFKDPYERYRLHTKFDRLPIMLFKDTEPWTNLPIVPTPVVEHYVAPKPSFKPPGRTGKARFGCSCTRRDGLQHNCLQVLMTN
nr:uncharacterized protein LOC106691456 [Halyomorpha halys]